MAFHIIQAQHGSPVVVLTAFVFLLHASAELVLDHLKKAKTSITDLLGAKLAISVRISINPKYQGVFCCLRAAEGLFLLFC